MNAIPSAQDQLADGLTRLGWRDSESLAERLIAFGAILLAENEKTNLVGAHALEDLVAAHFLDSLAPLAGETIASPVVDVGSGAGLPGLAAAIAMPELSFSLLEPRAKRAAFLERAVVLLGLRNVVVTKTSAETAGRSGGRSHAATALLRAVASPAVALELGLPLLTRGGRLLLYIGRQSSPTESEVVVASVLGGSLEKATRVDVPYLDAVRHAWWFRKVRDTPRQFPRRSQVPAREPLSP